MVTRLAPQLCDQNQPVSPNASNLNSWKAPGGSISSCKRCLLCALFALSVILLWKCYPGFVFTLRSAWHYVEDFVDVRPFLKSSSVLAISNAGGSEECPRQRRCWCCQREPYPQLTAPSRGSQKRSGQDAGVFGGLSLGTGHVSPETFRLFAFPPASEVPKASEVREGKSASELWATIEECNALQPEWSRVLPQHVVLSQDMPVSVKGEIQRQSLQKRMEPTLSWLLLGGPSPDADAAAAATWLVENLGSKEPSFDSLAMARDQKPPAELGHFYFVMMMGVFLCHHKFLVRRILDDKAAGNYHALNNLWGTMSMQGFAMYAGYVDERDSPTFRSLWQLLIVWVFGRLLKVAKPGVDSSCDYPWFFMFMFWARLLHIVTRFLPTRRAAWAVRLVLASALHFGTGFTAAKNFLDIEGGDPQPLAVALVPYTRQAGSHLILWYFGFGALLGWIKPFLVKTASCKCGAALLLSAVLKYFSIINYEYERDPSSGAGYSGIAADVGHDMFVDILHCFLSFLALLCVLIRVPRQKMAHGKPPKLGERLSRDESLGIDQLQVLDLLGADNPGRHWIVGISAGQP
ncbi:mdtL [Symbiodinium sp. CCMP2456]|nr:mdtL [Symbiodinium sp. CCMP2456]